MVNCYRPNFKTNWDSFKKEVHTSLTSSTSSSSSSSSSSSRITTKAHFSFSPALTETTKLYHRTRKQVNKSKKDWIFILIQFLDIGALLEFKYLLSNTGGDVLLQSTLGKCLLNHLQKKNEHNNKPLEILVVARPSYRFYADFIWSKKLISLLVRHAILLTQTRVNSTLGGAYASLHHIHKAAWWAKYQLYISTMLGDTFLQTKSLLHLAFYFIRVHQFGRARRIISSQRRKAIVIESDVLQVIADAADLALSKEIQAVKSSRAQRQIKGT